MNENYIGGIGKIFSSRREELGFSQEQLSGGLCDAQTVSKIERGIQLPRHELMVALMERLRLPTERYFGICSASDWEIAMYCSKIKLANARGDYVQAILLKNKLMKKFGTESNIYCC